MRIFSDTHRKNLARAALGNKNSFGIKRTSKEKEALSKRMTENNPMDNPANRMKSSISKTGRKQSIKERQNTSAIHKARVAEGKCHLYIDGRTPLNASIRHSLEYKLWREAIFLRDDWTCVTCGKKGGRIQADHIKPFSLFPELRFVMENGRTLCVPCHKQTPTYGAKLRWGKGYPAAV